LTGLLANVRYALRQLRKKPGLAAIAVLTLTLGVGANTAIFSVVDAIWLRPLPVHDPESLVRISDEKFDHSEEGVSYPRYLDYRTQSTAFSDIAAISLRGAILRTSAESKMLTVAEVSPNYFSVLGVSTVLGRTFTESELGRRDPPPVVVLDYKAWKRYFGGNPQIVGTTIFLTKHSCVVIGVLKRGFRGTEQFIEPEVWMPTTTWTQVTEDDLQDRGSYQFQLLARLAPGHSLQQARIEMNLIASRLAHEYAKTDANRIAGVAFEKDVRSAFLGLLSKMLLALAMLVLLIACFNVANLFLAYGEARRKEIATRVALGGNRLRLIWQLLIEGLPLSLLGTVLAVLVAKWVIHLLPSLLPTMELPVGFDFRLDTRVLLFSAALCLLSTVLSGIVPAFRSSAVAPITAMKESSDASGRRNRWSLPNLIVIIQLAASLVLLTGTGLLVRTLINVEARNPGFDRHRQLVLMYSALDTQPEQRQRYIDDVISRLHALPGVMTAAFARFVPFGAVGGGAKVLVSVPTRGTASDEGDLNLSYSNVTSEYFETMGIQIMSGRAFNTGDRNTSPKVIMISQALARRLFPGQNALYKYLRIGGAKGMDWQIVGIAQDAVYYDITESPQPYVYFPLSQQQAEDVTIVVSTSTDARSMVQPIVRAIHEVDSNVLLFDTETLNVRMRSATYVQRLSATLVTVLGLLALMLAGVGLYGVIAHSVSKRTHEIGVRMALGATSGRMLLLVIVRGFWLTGIGAVLGLATALALMRMLSSFLYGVSPSDMRTLVTVTALLLLVGISASIFPARRAAKVDPALSLHYE
jgi:predicted permease